MPKAPKKPNPYLKQNASQNAIGSTGRQSERRVAQELGARLTPASGAVAGYKSDMVLPTYRIEAKSTTTCTMAIKLEWLVKITEEALHTQKVPAVTISFVDTNGKSRRFGDWVMMPLHHYKELIGES